MGRTLPKPKIRVHLRNTLTRDRVKIEFKRAYQGDIWVLDLDTPPNSVLSNHTDRPESLFLYQVQVTLRVLENRNPWAVVVAQLFEKGLEKWRAAVGIHHPAVCALRTQKNSDPHSSWGLRFTLESVLWEWQQDQHWKSAWSLNQELVNVSSRQNTQVLFQG